MKANSILIRPLLVAVVLSTGCGESTQTTAPSTAPTTTTEVYAGTLAPGRSGFYSFRVSNPGIVNVTLASLTSSASGNPVSAAMRIGLGIPAGDGCDVTTSVTTAPGLRAQLTSQAAANIYCVELADPGSLGLPVAFGVRIVHP